MKRALIPGMKTITLVVLAVLVLVSGAALQAQTTPSTTCVAKVIEDSHPDFANQPVKFDTAVLVVCTPQEGVTRYDIVVTGTGPAILNKASLDRVPVLGPGITGEIIALFRVPKAWGTVSGVSVTPTSIGAPASAVVSR